MTNSKPEYIIRFFFEWMGTCFWGDNDAAQERFDYYIEPEELPLSESTIKRANELMQWQDKALNWEYPPDPGPWRQEECDRFHQAARELLSTVRQELGARFEVLDELDEMQEDPDLDAYLRNPKGFKRKV